MYEKGSDFDNVHAKITAKHTLRLITSGMKEGRTFGVHLPIL